MAEIEGKHFMTTSAAENTAGRVADKEKVEKRRALGRGLESLLPGPRVVGSAPRPVGPPHGPSPHIPAPAAGVPFDGTIRAVVDEVVEDAARAGIPSTLAQGRSAPHTDRKSTRLNLQS